jgi:hypothetical protein
MAGQGVCKCINPFDKEFILNYIKGTFLGENADYYAKLQNICGMNDVKALRDFLSKFGRFDRLSDSFINGAFCSYDICVPEAAGGKTILVPYVPNVPADVDTGVVVVAPITTREIVPREIYKEQPMMDAAGTIQRDSAAVQDDLSAK